MRRPARRIGAGLVLLGLLVAGAGNAQYGSPPADSDAPAQDEPQDDEATAPDTLWAPKPKGHWPMGKRTKDWVTKAYDHIGEEQLPEARDALGNLVLSALNPLERASAYQAYAFIEYGEGDLDEAVAYLEKAIAEEAFERDRVLDIRFQIAQLHLAQEHWQEVIDNLRIWFRLSDDPNSSAYYLLALAHFQLNEMDEALPPAQKAVELSDEPQEGWLQLLLALRLSRKEYEQSIPLIEELVRRFPKKDYWVQLSTVHGALGNYEEALVPLQLAYEQDLLTEDEELRRLGQMLLFLELPYRAAKVLQDGLDSGQVKPEPSVYEMLSNAWIAAREFEKAVAPLEKAAELSRSGDTYMRLAQVHLQREQWGEAVEAVQRALDAETLSSRGQAWLLLGIARYSREQTQQAIESFRRAREFEDSRAEADNWLAYLQRELRSAS